MTSLRDWYPLESSPEVFTKVSREWGLDPRYSWVDILGLDDPSLEVFEAEHGVGHTHAIVLLFPDTPQIVQHRHGEGPCMGVGKGEEVVYIPQVDVGHACGTFAMIHSFGVNGLAPKLKNFFAECKGVTPEERTRLFATSTLIKNAHNSAVDAGQTHIRESDWDDCDHFISFVKATVKGEERLLEMDGVPPRSGPLDRGPCEDLLRDVAKVLLEVYLPRADGDRTGHFSMMALVD